MKNWIEERTRLRKSFKFKSFKEAWGFMNQVAKLAEEMNHHPDWSNSYNRVTINLSTHDQGSIVTEKDKAFAIAIDLIADEINTI